MWCWTLGSGMIRQFYLNIWGNQISRQNVLHECMYCNIIYNNYIIIIMIIIIKWFKLYSYWMQSNQTIIKRIWKEKKHFVFVNYYIYICFLLDEQRKKYYWFVMNYIMYVNNKYNTYKLILFAIFTTDYFEISGYF